ncbi:SDR family NAD(P)-dependent oxidoreductase [Jiangella alkaliphila]|uniref:NAD(P)-dependent dehydrogenase, short-chain alcohol dehydrogenase family n=1 Tax=Jiangella alkaliphila TaxID=419479 RepID=A0A1H2G2M8_9ACTN|nr:SDR family oxidoreductase [Jiangella alkaliphila]SDU13787.1 NAD(P)-dependent dehydrogenase, short-chain alcohol dehydrogenase family [Jiangella alkaliphila]
MWAETVAVTGAGSGIGRAVLLAAAARGARVAALDVNEAAAASVAEQALTAGAARAVAVRCDVASESSVAAAFDTVSAAVGDPGAVYANAGIEVNAALHEFPAGDWERVVAVNLVGVFLTCREALRRLVDAGRGGSVVCTSSPAAFVGHSGGGNSAYAASKGGVSAFVRSAALDYAPYGIRVNAVVPGATDTAMLTAGGADPDRLRAAAATQIPLGRLGRPDEVAAAVLWLLSGESSYVTGSHLVCDGGLMAKSANDF